MKWILLNDGIKMIPESEADEVLIQRIVDGVEIVSIEGVRFEIGDDSED